MSCVISTRITYRNTIYNETLTQLILDSNFLSILLLFIVYSHTAPISIFTPTFNSSRSHLITLHLIWLSHHYSQLNQSSPLNLLSIPVQINILTMTWQLNPTKQLLNCQIKTSKTLQKLNKVSLQCKSDQKSVLTGWTARSPVTGRCPA